MNMLVSIAEPILAMGIGNGKLRLFVERSVLFVFFIKRRARNRGVEHELMKIRVMTHRVINHLIDIVRAVVFEPNNRGAKNTNPQATSA